MVRHQGVPSRTRGGSRARFALRSVLRNDWARAANPTCCHVCGWTARPAHCRNSTRRTAPGAEWDHNNPLTLTFVWAARRLPGRTAHASRGHLTAQATRLAGRHIALRTAMEIRRTGTQRSFGGGGRRSQWPLTTLPVQQAFAPLAPVYTWLLSQQKLLGPIAVWPIGQLEFEQALPTASSPTTQQRPPIWISGDWQGPHMRVCARRT